MWTSLFASKKKSNKPWWLCSLFYGLDIFGPSSLIPYISILKKKEIVGAESLSAVQVLVSFYHPKENELAKMLVNVKYKKGTLYRSL